MNTTEVQEHLRQIGWPIAVDGDYGPVTRAAVRDFQLGVAWYDMAVDGLAGPQTWHELAWCVRRGGRSSLHFAFREFASKGNGWIKVHRDLVRGLDHMRNMLGHPLPVVSGHRDPDHNRRVGGARNSQHLHGTAADIPAWRSVGWVRGLGRFTGIGFNGATGLVRHVDTRPGNPARPVIWRY